MATEHRGIWSGTVGFGLVSVPVALVTALRTSRSSFRLIHEPDKSRIRQRMYCPAHALFVHPEHIQRGYEVEPGEHVIVRDDEIEALEPKRSKSIEIQEFVECSAILPAYIDRPYYMIPTGPAKPYRLLVETLAAEQRAGIAEFVMHGQEHFCAVQSVAGVLCLLLLRYPEEVRSPDELVGDWKAVKEDVSRMRKAIDKARKPFDPDALENEYQKRVDKLVARKRRRKEVVHVVEAERPTTAEGAAGEPGSGDVDLVAALEESLARERSGGS